MSEQTALAQRPGTALRGASVDESMMRKLLKDRDLSQLSEEQQWSYYLWVCESIGLDPVRFPFDLLSDDKSGKLTLYANKECANQLRDLRNVNIIGLEEKQVGDLFIVTATASLPNGRTDTDIGAAATIGHRRDGGSWQLTGDALANAMLKATTKAKRRVTLSICGLGFLDQSEAEDVPGTVTVEAKSVFEGQPDGLSSPEARVQSAPSQKSASAPQLATIAKLSRLLGRSGDVDADMTSAEAADRITELSRQYNERKGAPRESSVAALQGRKPQEHVGVAPTKEAAIRKLLGLAEAVGETGWNREEAGELDEPTILENVTRLEGELAAKRERAGAAH